MVFTTFSVKNGLAEPASFSSIVCSGTNVVFSTTVIKLKPEVVIKLSQAEQCFLSEQRLTADYLKHAQQWFAPIAAKINEHQKSAKQPFVVGINGCQGSGKSTLADWLSMQLQSQYQLSCAVLSLDDFYLNQTERNKLAKEIHPLFATRGVPGTHDTQLMQTTLTALKAGHPTQLPRFNKAIDNPFPQSEWPKLTKSIDVIIMEGWCWGAPPQEKDQLKAPINELEQQQDPNGTWREYVNQQLLDKYQGIFALSDLKLMLKAPSFECVMQWRLEQEQKLAARLKATDETSGVMSEAQVRHFISYFQRLTEHSLSTQPAQSDVVWQLDANRSITSMEQNS